MLEISELINLLLVIEKLQGRGITFILFFFTKNEKQMKWVEKETENIKTRSRFMRQWISQINDGKYHNQERGSIGPGQQPKKNIVRQ